MQKAPHIASPCWAFVALVCCVGLSLLARPALALEIALTPAEQNYVRQNPVVRYCVDPDWPPFERIDEHGEHEGIAADLIALVAQRTGLRFELVRTKDWEESLEASRQGRCTVLSFLNSSPKREQWLQFTEPMLNDPNVLIARETHPYIADPAGLSGESIVLPEGTSVEERIRRDYPNLRVILSKSEQEALDMVSDRRADLTLRSLIVAADTIRKEGLFNLKIAGQIPNSANKLRMGVVKGEPVLRAVLNKGVRTITPQEREQIINRHVAINAQMGVDYSLIVKVVAGFLFLGAIGLYWSLRLKRLNDELKRLSQTDMLTGLYNRTMLDEQFRQELERARRYNRPFSLIMFDIDRFKAVNDDFGHLMGDKVLVAISAAAKKSVRGTDILGRWGGEEFLVLCPETATAEALLVAERIRAAISEATYPTGRTHTISAGVASLGPEDTVDTLLQRADTALYAAKDDGRDTVRSR